MRLSLVAAAAVFCAVATAAHAGPVTYTLTGTFTGTIGTQSFADDPGTITFASNTSGITNLGGGFYTDTTGTGTIELNGIGKATFLSPTFGAYSASYAAGFYDMGNAFGADDYDPLNPALASYTLTAPFTDTGFLLFGSTSSELTSLGTLTLTGDFGSSATFTTSTAASTTTPEPSSFFLVATSLLGAAGALRKRFARGTP